MRWIIIQTGLCFFYIPLSDNLNSLLIRNMQFLCLFNNNIISFNRKNGKTFKNLTLFILSKIVMIQAKHLKFIKISNKSTFDK